MLRKKKKTEADTPQVSPSADTAAEKPTSGADTAPSASVPVPEVKPKAGPGRPATKPHCLRCGKRLERCRCKDGALFSETVERATVEAQKRAAEPLGREEAEQLLRVMCWMLGIVESSAAALLTKLTWNEAEEVWSFTEEDITALLPPAHRVLAKYAHKIPAWLRDLRDEMMLAMAIVEVHRAKGSRAAELIAAKEKAKSAERKPQLVEKKEQREEMAREATA